jgi:hypothetical protein
MSMPTGWKLRVGRDDRVEHFIARTPDRRSAIAAVRRRPGMKDATIFVLGEASAEDLSFLALRDGEARRVGGVLLVDLQRGDRSSDPQV